LIQQDDRFLVIASDGVWDFMTDEDMALVCRDDQTTKKIAQQVVRISVQRGSRDNISVAVVKFN
jgi:serine/threonine protein phosphatase PrpC